MEASESQISSSSTDGQRVIFNFMLATSSCSGELRLTHTQMQSRAGEIFSLGLRRLGPVCFELLCRADRAPLAFINEIKYIGGLRGSAELKSDARASPTQRLRPSPCLSSLPRLVRSRLKCSRVFYLRFCSLPLMKRRFNFLLFLSGDKALASSSLAHYFPYATLLMTFCVASDAASSNRSRVAPRK